MTASTEDCVVVQTGRTSVKVSSRHGPVLQAVRAMFPELLADQSAAAPHLASTHAFTIERGPGAAFVFRSGEFATSLPWPELVTTLEHRLAQALLAGQANHVHMHAAGIGLDGQGVLILGPSGAGKSTLALELMTLGGQLLGDDVVLLGSAGVAERFPRRPKVDVDQALRLGISPSSTILWHSDADECWLDPGRWSGWSDPVEVRWVVAIDFQAGQPLHVGSLSASELVSHLMAALFPSSLLDAEPERCSELLLRLAQECRGLALSYGEECNAAAALVQMITGETRAPEGTPVVD